METLSNNATRLIGPLCAGSLYAFVGLAGIFSVQFFMYILALRIYNKVSKVKKHNLISPSKKLNP